MNESPMFCPICKAKNEENWRYLCSKCWTDFIEWLMKKSDFSDNIDVEIYLPKYMREYKMKVEFT